MFVYGKHVSLFVPISLLTYLQINTIPSIQLQNISMESQQQQQLGVGISTSLISTSTNGYMETSSESTTGVEFSAETSGHMGGEVVNIISSNDIDLGNEQITEPVQSTTRIVFTSSPNELYVSDSEQTSKTYTTDPLQPTVYTTTDGSFNIVNDTSADIVKTTLSANKLTPTSTVNNNSRAMKTTVTASVSKSERPVHYTTTSHPDSVSTSERPVQYTTTNHPASVSKSERPVHYTMTNHPASISKSERPVKYTTTNHPASVSKSERPVQYTTTNHPAQNATRVTTTTTSHPAHEAASVTTKPALTSVNASPDSSSSFIKTKPRPTTDLIPDMNINETVNNIVDASNNVKQDVSKINDVQGKERDHLSTAQFTNTITENANLFTNTDAKLHDLSSTILASVRPHEQSMPPDLGGDNKQAITTREGTTRPTPELNTDTFISMMRARMTQMLNGLNKAQDSNSEPSHNLKIHPSEIIVEPVKAMEPELVTRRTVVDGETSETVDHEVVVESSKQVHSIDLRQLYI